MFLNVKIYNFFNMNINLLHRIYIKKDIKTVKLILHLWRKLEKSQKKRGEIKKMLYFELVVAVATNFRRKITK